MSTPAQSTALEVRKQDHRSLIAIIKSDQFQTQIKDSLPSTVSIEKFTAVTIAALNQNSDLLQADRSSFYNSIVRAAQEGLLPDGQDAVLNVYKTKVDDKWVKKVQFQRMKQGVLKQFKKAGINAFACCVYQNETFQLWNDNEGQHIKHTPNPFSTQRGEMIGAYAVAPMPSGEVIIATMDMESIMRARSCSKSGDGDNAPWNKWFDQMAEKSVLHRLRRRVSVLDEEAAAELDKLDDEFEDEETEEQPVQEPIQPAVPTGTEKRPSSLQSVVDQAEDVPPTPVVEDPGPSENDII